MQWIFRSPRVERFLGKTRRRAFTLVELLVVIAIIGILVALLLPAIQAAREAARRSQCKNAVKQVALACLLHEDSHDFMPSGGWGRFWSADPNRGYGKGQPGSWIYNVLTYMEESDLRDLGSGQAVTSVAFQEATKLLNQSPIAMFQCPTRRAPMPYKSSLAGVRVQTWLPGLAQTGGGVVKSDYAANSGDAVEFDTVNMYEVPDYATAETTALWTDTSCKITTGRGGATRSRLCQTGIMFYRSEVTLAQISDGTSSTYLLGEKYLRPEAYEGAAGSTESGWSLGENQSMYIGYEWDNHRVSFHPDRSAPGAGVDYYQPRQDTVGYENAGAFGSAHPAGLNMAMCDGSVQFISYDIDSQTHRALSTRSDAEIVNVFEAE
jgi:prepilin-type N-terminal cleavage/methylation domain-containing protein/prepilin-type processing-associated H-X9-DG protein